LDKTDDSAYLVIQNFFKIKMNFDLQKNTKKIPKSLIQFLYQSIQEKLDHPYQPCLSIKIEFMEPNYEKSAYFDSDKFTIFIQNPFLLFQPIEWILPTIMEDYKKILTQMFLIVLVHELVHVYQHVYKLQKSHCAAEKQANMVAKYFAKKFGMMEAYDWGIFFIKATAQDWEQLYKCNFDV
jgi:hypothetical protein